MLQVNRGLHDASDLTCQSQNVRNATCYRSKNIPVEHLNQKTHCSTFEPCPRTKTNDQAGSPHYLMRWILPQTIKEVVMLLTD
jgi:hypothetical protein